MEVSGFGYTLLMMEGNHENEVKIGDRVYAIYNKNIKNEIKDIRVLK